MSDTPRLNFPYIVSSHILDALVQPVVEGALVNTPPASPAAGVLYVVGGSPNGAWTGKAECLAQYVNDVWTFYVPFEGLTAWNKASKSRWYYSGTEWSELSDDQHGKRTDNPHKVTAVQVGAETPSGAQSKANAVQTNLTAHINNGTHKWSSITDKPSKLQDYGIVDAYTKAETDSLTDAAKTQIGAEQGELGVEIKGRTLVNLLGKNGNFETISSWSGYHATLSLDQTSVRYGSNRVKVTISPTWTAGYVFVSLPMYAGKYYICLADVINGNATNVGVAPNTFGIGTINTSTTAYMTSYKKFAPGSDITTAMQIVVNGTEGQYAYADGFRFYEITQAEYNAIDSMTEAQIAAKYPYVDSVQFKKDVLVTQIGKNLLPSLYSSDWSPRSNYTLNSDYSTTVTNPEIWAIKYVMLNVVEGKTYTGSVTVTNVATVGRVGLHYACYDANGVVLSSNFLCSTNVTSGTFTISGSITMPANTVTCRIGFDNESAFTGTCTFSNFQFELGSTATTFEPQIKSYAHTPMQIAQAESVWLTPNTSVYKEVWKKNVVLDGSLSWSFNNTNAGLKGLYMPSFPPNSSCIVTKFDAKPLLNTTTTSITDNTFISSNGSLVLTISNADSGWTDTMGSSVTQAEIKAYFYGWKMCASDGGTYVSGTKYWKKITDGTGITSTTPTASYPGYTPYVLHYKLATPVYHINYYNNDPTKPIMSAGSVVNIPQGVAQIEQKSGVSFREKATPFVDSANSSVYINSGAIAYALQKRVSKFITAFKNGTLDTVWNAVNHAAASIPTYGASLLKTAITNYDSTSTYTVIYEQLDKYLYTIDAFAIDNPVPTRQRNFSLDSTEQKIACFKVNPVSLVGATANQNPKTLADYGILDAYTKDVVDGKLTADTMVSGVRKLYNVARYSYSGGSITGAFKITLPAASAVSLRMMIEGYTHYPQSSWYLETGGLLNSSSAWVYPSVILSPNAPISTVTFGKDANNNTCIILGSVTTVWSQPSIMISEVIAGFSGASSMPTNFTVSMVTDISDITGIVTPTIKTLATLEGVRLTPITQGYDLNTLLIPNKYLVSQPVNGPSTDLYYWEIDVSGGSLFTSQIAVKHAAGQSLIYHRHTVNSGMTWSDWKQIAMTDSPTFTGTVSIVTTSTNPILNFQRNQQLSANSIIGYLGFIGGNDSTATAGVTYGSIQCQTTSYASGAESGVLTFATRVSGASTTRTVIDSSSLRPATTNAYTLGASSYLWAQLYAATATINTSDRNAKTDITDLDLGLDFINSLRPVEYKYKVRQNEVTTEQCGVETVEIEPERIETREVSPAVYEEVEISPAVYSTIEITPAEYDEEGNVITEAVLETILEHEAVIEQRLVSEAVTEEVVIPAVTEERPVYKEVVTPLPGVRTHAGLIAQEVEKALNGKDVGIFTVDEAGSYGLRYEEFVAPLVKAIQELSAKVEQQAVEIAKLKNKGQ